MGRFEVDWHDYSLKTSAQLSSNQPMSAKCCLQWSPVLQKEIAGAPKAGGSQAAIREVVYIRNSVSSENASGAFDYSEPGISF